MKSLSSLAFSSLGVISAPNASGYNNPSMKGTHIVFPFLSLGNLSMKSHSTIAKDSPWDA